MAQPLKLVKSASIRLLLVEDSRADVELEMRALQRAGLQIDYRVVETEAAFRKALAEFQPDLILSDFSMPKFDGLSALRIARELSPDTPFIFVSGTIGEEHAILALKQGAADYVLKTNLLRLPAAVERALETARERATRRETEQALRQSEGELRRFRLALDNSADVILIIDRSTMRIVDANQAACRLIGYTREELLRMGPQDLLPVSRSELEKTYDALIAKPSKSGMRSYYRCKDGSQLPFESTRHVLRSDDSWLIAVVSRDIRSRLAAEKALQESEAALRRAQDMARLAHIVTGPDGKFESWSDSLPKLLGAPAKLPRSTREWLQLVHPEDRVQMRDMMIQAGKRGTRLSIEYRMRHADGAWMHFNQVLEPVEDPLNLAGKTRWFNTIRDVTAEKQAAEELRSSEARHRATFEQAAVGIAHTSLDGSVQIVNPVFCAMTGYTRTEAIQLKIEDLIHADDIAHCVAGRAQMLSGKLALYERELRLLKKDRSATWVHITTSLVRGADGKPSDFISVIDDISERRHAEDSLRESEARFRSLIELSSDFYWETDAEHRMISTQHGRDHKPIVGTGQIGKRRWESPSTRPNAAGWAAHRATLDARKPFRDFEIARIDPAGVERHLSISGEPVFDESGAFKGYRGIGRDITARMQAEFELQRFRMAMDVSIDSIYLTDPATMRFVYLNDTACKRLGYSREQLLQMGPLKVFPMTREQIGGEYEEVIAAGDAGTRTERRFVRSDGSEGWTELHRRALRTHGGTLIVTIARDITERKRTEDKIKRLSRVHAVLSGINALIVRVQDRSQLLSGACRIAFEQGGYPLAWIGMLDAKTQDLEAAAMAGTALEYGTVLRPSVRADIPAGQGTNGRAFRERRPILDNDMAANPRVGHRRDEGLKAGMRAILSLPLLVEGAAVGVLALYAKEKNYFDDDEVKLLTELASDIAFALDHLEKEQRLDYLAFYDQLTGLANRTLFLERLKQFVHSAGPAGGKFALVLTDIERLRTINESLGRQAGDAVIAELAKRLGRCADEGELARIGADHFAIVLPSVKGKSEVTRRIGQIWSSCLGEPFRVEGAELKIAAKSGIAVFPNDAGDAETLLRNAEAALGRGKDLGEAHTYYTSALTERTAERLTLENRLRQALEKDEFVLHYQPKVETESRRIVGVEALIRWQNPELGLVPPMQFIPLMEETGLILEAGAWALQRAALDHARWFAQGLVPPRVAVNVSAIQLRQRGFVASVERAIIEGIAPTGIDLEITESLVMEDIESNIEKLKAVRALGIGLAIDDFGTGYSSLGYLAKLPAQTLKIDRSFIITMLTDRDTMTLVQTIVSLAHSLRLKVVAEGVENEEQAKILRLLRCDEMQGYLFSRPVPFEAMSALLEAARKA